MRKLFIIFSLLFFISSTIFAQLEVNDTLLMARNNPNNLVYWTASSELESLNDSEAYEMGGYSDYGKYGSTNLGDDNAATCWAEGSEGNGANEYIYLTIPYNTTKLRIRNGYQKNETIFKANNRPQDIIFEIYSCYEPSGYVTESHTGFFLSEKLASSKAVLKDIFGYQDVELDINWTDIHSELSHDNTFEKDRFILKILISSIYKGSKWNDACISDINIISKPYFDLTIDEHGLIKVLDLKTDTLFYNNEIIYQVVDLSLDLEWIIFIEMPSDIESSRVETEYKLYNTEKEQFITPGDLTMLYGFKKESGKLYLEGSDKDFNDKIILLDNIK